MFERLVASFCARPVRDRTPSASERIASCRATLYRTGRRLSLDPLRTALKSSEHFGTQSDFPRIRLFTRTAKTWALRWVRLVFLASPLALPFQAVRATFDRCVASFCISRFLVNGGKQRSTHVNTRQDLWNWKRTRMTCRSRTRLARVSRELAFIRNPDRDLSQQSTGETCSARRPRIRIARRPIRCGSNLHTTAGPVFPRKSAEYCIALVSFRFGARSARTRLRRIAAVCILGSILLHFAARKVCSD